MAEKNKFEKILEPGYIGKVKTRNRILKTGAGMEYGYDGFVTDKHKAFYGALARGGVGLIIVESCGIDYPLGLTSSRFVRLDDDKFIPGFSELTKVIHGFGCPTFLQFMHPGPWYQFSQLSGLQPLTSSSLTASEVPEPPLVPLWRREAMRGLTIAEIGEMVEKYTRAAERAAQAGFDGVEITAASSHLIDTFLSRVWNKRQDQYGPQSLENRARFLVEIVQSIKKRLGRDFPVGTIINGAEFGVDNGITLADSQEFARILQAAGADSIHVRSFGYGDYPEPLYGEELFYPELQKTFPKEIDVSHKGAGAIVPMAAAIKKAISIPVITVGRLDPVLGEQILRDGKADFIGMTRRLLADPELPNKIAAGRIEDIVPCTACMTCTGMASGAPDETLMTIRCRVNAALGDEKDYMIQPAEKRKKVVVIGGGPGGMEAARVAALRGHQVTLYEKEPKLGGLLPLAALVKGTEIEDLPALVKYLETQVNKLGVDIKLSKEFTVAQLAETKPDVVILAAGAVASLPDIPGIEKSIVVSGASLHQKLKSLLRHSSPESLRSLTRLWMPVGKRVIVIGGGIQGCELAEFLVKRGRKVTIVESGKPEKIGEDVPTFKRVLLLPWLAQKGVVMISGVKYEEITEKGLVITTQQGQRQTIEADSVVTATSMTPNLDLFKALEGKVAEVYAIGDCRKPSLITDAIADGFHVANVI